MYNLRERKKQKVNLSDEFDPEKFVDKDYRDSDKEGDDDYKPKKKKVCQAPIELSGLSDESEGESEDKGDSESEGESETCVTGLLSAKEKGNKKGKGEEDSESDPDEGEGGEEADAVPEKVAKHIMAIGEILPGSNTDILTSAVAIMLSDHKQRENEQYKMLMNSLFSSKPTIEKILRSTLTKEEKEFLLSLYNSNRFTDPNSIVYYSFERTITGC